ncbi:hypothetical protein EX075_13910 [Salmonella enterica]|nr:hypothetical protein [Salmonella enterica]EGK9673213.1 hypothetical protein [Salmonella enterica]
MGLLIIYLVGVAFTDLLINTLDGRYMPGERKQRSIALFLAVIWPLILFAGLAFALFWGLMLMTQKFCHRRAK